MESVHLHAVAQYLQGNGRFPGRRTPAPGRSGVGGGARRGFVGWWLEMGRRRRRRRGGIGGMTRSRRFHDGRRNSGRLIYVYALCLVVSALVDRGVNE